MKKQKKYLLLLLTLLLFATVPVVYAWQTGDQSTTGGQTGTQLTSAGDLGEDWDSGTYLFEFVYRPQNSNNRETIGCVVAYSGSTKATANAGYRIQNIETLARDVANNNNCKYVNSGALGALAKKLFDGNALDNMMISEEEVAKEYLQQFGLNINNYNKPGSEPGNINSYGYRILIQKLTCFGTKTCSFLYPRKEFARDYPNNMLFGGSYQNDLYTTKDDIGISAARITNWIPTHGNCTNDKNMCKPLGKYFADSTRGEGYNIIGFHPNVFNNNVDYSIDAACENCDNNNEDGSYFIQDTTDWEAILNSPNSTNDNAKKYFKKTVGNCTVYCREEYRVTFPNANNQITAEAGRFFTINKLGGAMYAAGVPNFKQIKVEKVRECRATGGNQQSCLASFASSAKTRTGSSAGQSGTIELTYKETLKNSKYDTKLKLEENKNRTISKEEYVNSTVGSSSVMLKSTITKYYELPDETYQWVDIRDGVSSLKKPTTGIEHFLDLKTSNLPISQENYSKTSKPSKGAEVTFKYSLPTNSEDPYTLISKAFNSKNDYFLDASSKPDENLYAKANNNKLTAEENVQIKQSACAKLFGTGTSKYNSCVSARTSNKMGNCYSQVTVDGKYKCDVNVCPEGEILCEPNTCSQNKECLERRCQILNGVYYGPNGEVLTPQTSEKFYEVCPNKCRVENGNYYCGADGHKCDIDEYLKECPNTCRIENGKYYGQNGTEVSKEEYMVECPQICKVVDGKYYGKKGQLVSKSQYDKECPGNDNFCTLCNGGKCCPDLDMVCPDMNGECPGRGNRIIYRPIDLANPFPGQTNYDRATGANWCGYNIKTGKINCKSTNGVATTHIQNNRQTEDEGLYDLTPLYEVNLDPTIMKNIRKYNKTNKYDDFTLDCTNGKTCYSTFLREGKTGLKVTGLCANKANATTCAESRG